MKILSTILVLCGLIFISSLASADEGQDGTMDLLFIHHSCGGQLFADPGEAVGGESGSGERCIYVSHPNGGGLRKMLEAEGYSVNEASYGSIVGEDTDICHWRAKFANQMDRVLHTQRQDELLPDGRTNEIVCFKSCYPNNQFVGQGDEPGDPDDCTRTVANAKAAYRDILPFFREHPEVLFVTFTAPPMAEYVPVGWKAKIKSWFNKNDRGGEFALDFNAWLTDGDHGWLAGYDLPNVVVFDHYGVLSEGNEKGYATYPTGNGNNSHPSAAGNQKSAAAFVPFMAAAVDGMNWPQP